jgi:hypothetical protein
MMLDDDGLNFWRGLIASFLIEGAALTAVVMVIILMGQ